MRQILPSSPNAWRFVWLLSLLSCLECACPNRACPISRASCVGHVMTDSPQSRNPQRYHTPLLVALRGGRDESESDEPPHKKRPPEASGPGLFSPRKKTAKLSLIVSSLKQRFQRYVKAFVPKKRELQITKETFMDVCDEIEALLPCDPLSCFAFAVALLCVWCLYLALSISHHIVHTPSTLPAACPLRSVHFMQP